MVNQIIKSSNHPMIKEACVENFSQAIRAQELGADRIELCDNLAEGGTTPSLGTLIACRKYLKIPVIVMVRPRGGNFVYDRVEMEIMEEDIKTCLNAGASGIAIGLLTHQGEVDMPRLRKLLVHAGSMQVTFHRAIDETHDIEKEFLRLRDSGLIHRVLTSGGKPTAMEGAGMLKRMIELSNGKVTVLPAGKITADNLTALAGIIGAYEYHGKKIVGDPG